MDFLEGLDGVFAAVVFDGRRQVVHLISDRYGLRHLNWTSRDGHLAWASELKCLLELPGFNPRIDPLAVQEFLNIGWLLDNRTWFQGVELLGAATILTYGLADKRIARRRYWWWDGVEKPTSHRAREELEEELAAIIQSSVARRCGVDQLPVVTLSGGMDSRSLLAALPVSVHPITTVTFGPSDCVDVRLASMSAKVAQDKHLVVNIDAQNWLDRRVEAVWWTDGRKDLQHMQILGAYGAVAGGGGCIMDGLGAASLKGTPRYGGRDPVEFLEKQYSCTISALPDLADRVRAYYQALGSLHVLNVDSRMRAFSIDGPKLANALALEYQLPLMAKSLQDFAFAHRDASRSPVELYHGALLRGFPDYFRSIPEQKSGVPVSWPGALRQSATWGNRVLGRLRPGQTYVWGQGLLRRRFADYAAWLRCPPGRSLASRLLGNPQPLFRNFLPEGEVQSALEQHAGGIDRTRSLYRYLTLEIWLQQVFEGRYRHGVISDDGSPPLIGNSKQP
jgi:asparagine synthase (glutamine-hydrolysing)